MTTYVFTKQVPLSTTAAAPSLSPTQKIDEKYITGVELIVDTGTPAGLPIGVQLRAGSRIIWPDDDSNDKWVRAPVGLRICHKLFFENEDPHNYTVYWINGDTAAHYAEVHVFAENHSDGILRLAILQLLKGLAAKLEALLPAPGKNGEPLVH
jgi:hypothetical protein